MAGDAVTRVSLNELRVRYTRALQGIGLPAGTAADAAAIAQWHDIVGLDGARRLLDALPRLGETATAPPALSRQPDGWRLDAAGASLFALGGVLVDTLEMAASAGVPAVILAEARDVAVLGGCADLAAARGLAADLRCADAAGTLTAASDGARVWWALRRGPADPDVPANSVVARTARPAAEPGADAGPCRRDPGTIARHRAAALDRGVPVADAEWRRIVALAELCLVEDRETGIGRS